MYNDNKKLRRVINRYVRNFNADRQADLPNYAHFKLSVYGWNKNSWGETRVVFKLEDTKNADSAILFDYSGVDDVFLGSRIFTVANDFIGFCNTGRHASSPIAFNEYYDRLSVLLAVKNGASYEAANAQYPVEDAFPVLKVVDKA